MATELLDQTELIKTDGKRFKITRSRVKYGLLISIVVFGIVALIGIIIYTEIYIHSHKFRIDCNPDLPLNYHNCIARGCLWVQRLGDEPPCFFPNGYGYRYTNVKNTSSGYFVQLKRAASKSMFGHEIEHLNLTVQFLSANTLRLKFDDRDNVRYEVPIGNDADEKSANADMKLDYSVEFSNEPQFGIQIKRLSTGKIIFDSNVPGMIFSNQFLQLTTKLPSSYLYGFGERLANDYRVNMNWKRITLFARDNPPINSANLYGVHPIYMNLEDDGNANGVFLLNSNAMEIFTQPYPAVTFRTIGGILDFYVFLGSKPEEVVQQYSKIVGLPVMPPYWSLGFQLSRYGYKDMEDVKKVVKRTIDNNIPYDVQYLDIDYMENMKSFTIDKEKFGTLGSFTDDLHAKGVKLILILDPFIASNETLKGTYPALDNGITRDVFIKSNGEILEGNCWPGNAFYPDFTNPATVKYWSELCSNFSKDVKYDGLWIDMNEPSNFVQGSLQGCNDTSINYPPYSVGVLGSENDRKIFDKTLCMDADQYAGKHYDLHSLYGYHESIATFEALKAMGKRPMILSRSTFSGSGRYAAHWLGDNFATWPQLRASIPGILQFNMFGIPMVGSDICGFWQNTTNELCSRWMQLGSFYPFSRNHNGIGCNDQDPAALGKDVMNVSRQALSTRYELLPYLYTLFYKASTNGGTVARPLLHEFPKDKTTWNINYQFLWGPALLISPIVHLDAQSVRAYFPDGMWYDFYSGASVTDGEGKFIDLPDKGKVNLHVRGGYILPLQVPKKNTQESRNEAMGLFVAPNKDGAANGDLFWDDGESNGPVESKKYLLSSFSYNASNNINILSGKVLVNGYKNENFVGYVTICQQMFPPSKITINNIDLGKSKFKYDSSSKVLRLTSLEIQLSYFSMNIVK